jgi:outer membrane protein TolC
VDSLLDRVRLALQMARKVEKEGLMPRSQVLAYQRALLDAVTLLSLRRQDLELSKAELVALMSIPPGVNIVLADDTRIESLPSPPANIAALEALALRQRPEIMEEWYRKRVTENDIKAAKLLVWPNVSFDISGQYDSNIYLYNQSWIDTGLRVSWNIMKLAQLPALERAQESQNQTDDMRRMALSMAVLTQVRVGVQRYALSRMEFGVAEESLRVDEELLKYARAAARTSFDSELEVIRAEARALLSRYQQHAAYSNAQAAWGRVYNSVGLDVMPETIASHDIKTLAAAIDTTLRQWQENLLAGPAFDGSDKVE